MFAPALALKHEIGGPASHVLRCVRGWPAAGRGGGPGVGHESLGHDDRLAPLAPGPAPRVRVLAFSSAHSSESPLAKFLISGGVTWVFELFVGHYLEFLKISKQTSDLSYAQITRNMVRHKGLAGVLDGYFPWGSLQALAKGSVFGLGHAMARTSLDGVLPDHIASVAAGGIGGGFQGIVLSPLLLLKTRVMTDPSFRSSGGLWTTTVQSARVGARVITHEGVSALMKGSVVFSGKRVADWTTRFLFAELFDKALRSVLGREELSLTERSAAALLGGTTSAVVTLPIDVLVATFQDAKKAGQRVSVLDVWREKLRTGGVTGLVRYSSKGSVARIAHVALTTLLMKTLASAVYRRYEDFVQRRKQVAAE